VFCAALTAVLFVDIMRGLVAGAEGTALGLFAAVTVFAPLSDVGIAIARRRIDTWGLRLAASLLPFEYLFWPLAAPLAKLSSAIARRVEEPQAHDPDVASAEVEYLVDEVERSGVVGSDPAEIIRNVLEFEDLRATDVMIPRARIEGIELSTSLADVRQQVAESGHSRYPVYEGQLDNVVGLLYAKDVFKLDVDPAPGEAVPQVLKDVVRRNVIFVAETQKLVTLLKEMRQKRQHLAVVVDEFGGMAGIVTLEDVIEEIVGDIKDEHDDEMSTPIEETDDGRLLASATLRLGDLAAYLACEIPLDLHEENLAAALGLGDVEVGAAFERWGLVFTVSDVSPERKALRLEVARLPSGSVFPPANSSVPPSSTRTKDGDADAAEKAAG
jgi:CBS domain containing-hemolysin-like protein